MNIEPVLGFSNMIEWALSAPYLTEYEAHKYIIQGFINTRTYEQFKLYLLVSGIYIGDDTSCPLYLNRSNFPIQLQFLTADIKKSFESKQ